MGWCCASEAIAADPGYKSQGDATPPAAFRPSLGGASGGSHFGGGRGGSGRGPHPLSDCPIDLKAGHKLESAATDIHLALSGSNFVLSRQYTSDPVALNGAFLNMIGPGWRLPSFPRLYWGDIIWEHVEFPEEITYVDESRHAFKYTTTDAHDNAAAKWYPQGPSARYIIRDRGLTPVPAGPILGYVYTRTTTPWTATSQYWHVYSLVDPGGTIRHFRRKGYYTTNGGIDSTTAISATQENAQGSLMLEQDAHGNRRYYEYTPNLAGVVLSDNTSAAPEAPRVKSIWCFNADSLLEARIDFGWIAVTEAATSESAAINYVLQHRLRHVQVYRPSSAATKSERTIPAAACPMQLVQAVRYRYFDDFFPPGASWPHTRATPNELGSTTDLLQVEQYVATDGLESGGADESGGLSLVSGMTAPRVQIIQYRYYKPAEEDDNCPECEAIDEDAGTDAHGAQHQLRAVIAPEQIEFYAQRANDAGTRASLLSRAEELIVRSGTPVTQAYTETNPLWTENGHDHTIADLVSKLIGYEDESSSDRRVAYQWGGTSGCGCSGAVGAQLGVRTDYHYIAAGSGSNYGATVLIENTRTGVDTFTPYRAKRHDFAKIGGTGGLPEVPFLRNVAVFPVDDPGPPVDWGTPWVTHYAYDTDGNLIREMTPAAMASYSPSDPLSTSASAYTSNVGGSGVDGLVWAYGYSTTDGAARLTETRIADGTFSQAGDTGDGGALSSYAIVERTIYGSSSGNERAFLPKEVQRFRVEGVTGDGSALDTYVSSNPALVEREWRTYGFHANWWSTDAMAWMREETEKERVDENGPYDPSTHGAETSSSNHYRRVQLFDKRGRIAWSIDEADSATRYRYDYEVGSPAVVVGYGQLSAVTRNAEWDGSASNFGNVTVDWGTGTFGDGGALRTEYTRDLLGRVTMVKSPSGVLSYTRRVMRAWEDRPDLSYYAEVELPHVFGSSEFSGPAVHTYFTAGGQVIGAEDRAVTAMTLASSPGGSVHPVTSYTTGTQLAKSSQLHTVSGSLTASRTWHDVDGNGFYERQARHDALGRLRLEANPNGTLTRHSYDSRDLETRREVGTLAGGDIDDFLDDATGNLVTVSEAAYDANGSKTLDRIFRGSSYADTTYLHDFRDRTIQTLRPVAPHEAAIYDNLNRVTARLLYEVTPPAPPSALTPNTDLVRYEATAYSQRGLVYCERVAIDPDHGSGPDTSGFLESHSWHDPAGRIVASWSPTGPGTKMALDGLGRVTKSYTTDRSEDVAPGTSGNYASAVGDDFLDDDRVLEQTETRYIEHDDESEEPPAGTGLIDLITARLRTHDTSFPSTGNSGDLSGAGSGAIATFRGFLYDGADRQIKSIDFGCNNTSSDLFASGGSAPSLTSLPGWEIVDETSYNTRGLTDIQTDPDGKKTRLFYDDMNRVVGVVENFVDGAVERDSGQDWKWKLSLGSTQASTAEDRATITTYDGLGGMMFYVAAYNSTGTTVAYQPTRYIYGVVPTGQTPPTNGTAGSELFSNDLLARVIYPDGDTSSDNVSHKYNRQGEEVELTDQNGTTHVYARDVFGRIESDYVSALGTGIDGTVRSIVLIYDDAGRPSMVKSESAAPGAGSVLNAVAFAYDDLWNIDLITQNPLGAIATSSPPAWQAAVDPDYSAEKLEDGNHSRMLTLKYPSDPSGGTRTTLAHTYGSIGSFSDLVSRPESFDWIPSPADTPDAEFVYLGASSIVRTRLTKPYMELNRWVHPDTGIGASGTYSGLDRFGRVARQLWIPIDATHTKWDPANGTYNVDPYYHQGLYAPALFDSGYSYTKASDVTNRDDLRANGRVGRPARDEQYDYDGLHRLIQADRGKLAGSFTAGGSDRSQQWTLDALGNWKSVVTDLDTDGTYETAGSPIPDIVETRTHDSSDANLATRANEIVTREIYDVSEGSPPTAPLDPTYDAAGNMTVRPVYFEESGDIATADWVFTYDAWNRLVKVQVGEEDQPRATYSYNGLNQRVARLAGTAGTGSVSQANLYYYDASWRLLEERIDDGYTVSGTPSPFPLPPTGSSMSVDRIVQRIWGPEYIDQLLSFQVDGPTTGEGGGEGEPTPPDGDFTEGAVGFYALTDRLYNVVAVTDDLGILKERVRYTAYGVGRREDVTTARARGDWNGDGATDFADLNQCLAIYGTGVTLDNPSSAYDPDMDFDQDNDVDFGDLNRILTFYSTTYEVFTDGPISMQTIDNTIGYAGYNFDPATELYLARHRWLAPELGRWITRDPAGYIDGWSLYTYVKSVPFAATDPLGWSSSEKRRFEAFAIGAGQACLDLCDGGLSVRGWIWGGVGINTPLGWIGWSDGLDFSTRKYYPAGRGNHCGACDPCCKSWAPSLPGYLSYFQNLSRRVGVFGAFEPSGPPCHYGFELVALIDLTDLAAGPAAPLVRIGKRVASYLGAQFSAGIVLSIDTELCKKQGSNGVTISGAYGANVCGGFYFEFGRGGGSKLADRTRRSSSPKGIK